jgi:hypothetical protein
VSSFARELAKLIKEQYNATQAHHFSWKIRQNKLSQNLISYQYSPQLTVENENH